ncbi:uncharacterized protein PHACADRAFT_262931, partial [Phanerochaete carnosa HHB-10118-sp]
SSIVPRPHTAHDTSGGAAAPRRRRGSGTSPPPLPPPRSLSPRTPPLPRSLSPRSLRTLARPGSPPVRDPVAFADSATLLQQQQRQLLRLPPLRLARPRSRTFGGADAADPREPRPALALPPLAGPGSPLAAAPGQRLPPPFTLQPRPQWDEPTFSPFARRAAAAPAPYEYEPLVLPPFPPPPPLPLLPLRPPPPPPPPSLLHGRAPFASVPPFPPPPPPPPHRHRSGGGGGDDGDEEESHDHGGAAR